MKPKKKPRTAPAAWSRTLFGLVKDGRFLAPVVENQTTDYVPALYWEEPKGVMEGAKAVKVRVVIEEAT